MSIIQIGLIIFSILPLAASIFLSYKLKKNGSVVGSPSIHPLFFYPAKMSIGLIMGILVWVCISPEAFLSFPFLIQDEVADVQKLLSLIFLFAGNLLLLSGYYTLNTLTRVGLPDNNHRLIKNGVYRISRNPMYTSFIFLNVACFLLVPSLLYAAIALFNFITHHFIIQSEEKFLAQSFADEYSEYRRNVARYL